MKLMSRIAAAWRRFWLGRSLKEEFDAILAADPRAPLTDYAVHTRGDADYDDSMMPAAAVPLAGLDIVTGEVAAITPAQISEAGLDTGVVEKPSQRRANTKKKRMRKRGKTR